MAGRPSSPGLRGGSAGPPPSPSPRAGRMCACTATSAGTLAGEVAAAVEGLGGRSLVVVADIADPGAVSEAVGAVEQAFGAASTCSSTTRASSPRTGRPGRRSTSSTASSTVNLKGPLHCILAALPLLRASGGGVIVNVGGAQFARRLGRRTGLCGGPRRASSR